MSPAQKAFRAAQKKATKLEAAWGEAKAEAERLGAAWMAEVKGEVEGGVPVVEAPVVDDGEEASIDALRAAQ